MLLLWIQNGESDSSLLSAVRLVPLLCLWALRRETPAAACSLASIRAAQALETGPEPPSDGAESSSSTSDELWSPSSGDPPGEPGAFMAPFLSIISEQNHAQPSILCLYFAICQVRCPCRHSDSRNSPRAPATPSQVLSTRIEPAYPLQLSASRLMLELTEQPCSPRCVRRAHYRPCRRLLPRCPALAPAARSSSRRARLRRGAAQATASAAARSGFATDLCSWGMPRLCSVLDRRGLPPERP